MDTSVHTFTCGLITLTGSILNFVFDNDIAGWALLGVTAINFIIAYIIYRKEKKK